MCFVVGCGAFFPRIALILLWVLGPLVDRAFDGQWLVPLLGLLLLPYTTLVYVLVFWWQGTVDGYFWFFVALAFVVDVASLGSGNQVRR